MRHRLAPDRVLAVEPSRHGLVVRCLRGVVWVTQAGDAADHVLAAGESWRAARAGRVGIQALSAADVALEAA